MLRRSLSKRLGLWLLPLVISCTQTSLEESPPDVSLTMPSQPIILGEISDDPTEVVENFQPLADYLTKKLNNSPEGTGKVKVAPNMKTMAEWLKSGTVEVYFDSPYPAFLVSQASNAQPILSRWKGGVGTYKTVIFALRGKGINQIDDLKGKRIAFEENFSTSGYMLPYVYLTKQGLTLKQQTQGSQSPPVDEVAYLFSGNDKNSLQWVVSGRLAAAAMGSVEFEQLSDEVRKQFIILAETQSVPRHFVLVSPTLSPPRVAKLTKLLLQMNTTQSGQAVLAQFEATSKFTPLPREKADIFQEIRTLMVTYLE